METYAFSNRNIRIVIILSLEAILLVELITAIAVYQFKTTILLPPNKLYLMLSNYYKRTNLLYMMEPWLTIW